MNLELLQKKFEGGAEAILLVGTATMVFAIVVLTGYGVFMSTGFSLYSPALHHEYVVAHIDQWFAWVQILFIVFASFWITGLTVAGMAAGCYFIRIVIGAFSKAKKA